MFYNNYNWCLPNFHSISIDDLIDHFYEQMIVCILDTGIHTISFSNDHSMLFWMETLHCILCNQIPICSCPFFFDPNYQAMSKML